MLRLSHFVWSQSGSVRRIPLAAVESDPPRAGIEPGIHLCDGVRRVSGNVTSFGLKHQDRKVWEPANCVPYVAKRVFAACALFDFLKGCNLRWPDAAKDVSIASFADDRRNVEGLARLTDTRRIVDDPESIVRIVRIFVEGTVTVTIKVQTATRPGRLARE